MSTRQGRSGQATQFSWEYFHGHSGTGVRQWKPAEKERPLDVINIGQTEKGVFVVEISQERMRLGYQVTQDAAVVEDPEWLWEYLFEKPIQWTKHAADRPGGCSPVSITNGP